MTHIYLGDGTLLGAARRTPKAGSYFTLKGEKMFCLRSMPGDIIEKDGKDVYIDAIEAEYKRA